MLARSLAKAWTFRADVGDSPAFSAEAFGSTGLTSRKRCMRGDSPVFAMFSPVER